MLAMENVIRQTHPEEAGYPLPQGPLTESTCLSAGLDYYKSTMSQLAYENEPAAEVTFSFKNRGKQRLLDYIDPGQLQERLDFVRKRGFSPAEINYLASLRNQEDKTIFTKEYLDYLQDSELPPVQVFYDDRRDDLAIETTGPWALSTFWETLVMSEVNEAYFEGYLIKHGLDPMDVYHEGDRRLSEKVAILHANPDIQFADFGTRRHFSLRWQKHVLERLHQECPVNLVGTSNIALADSLGIKPIGTFAHEMPMTYAGLADARREKVRASHSRFLNDWFHRYGEDLSIALTDTFKTDFFFSDFTPEQAKLWRGVRQDSGDPIEFGEKLIQFYKELGINPNHKTVVFSDGLDIDQIVKLHNHFRGRIKILFGWGTTLTNDLGVRPLNVVMKVTHVWLPDGSNAETVKLSDDETKHTGTPNKIAQYAIDFATAFNGRAN